MSHRDSLTGLLNRRGYDEKFNEYYQRAQRNKDRFQIIFIDLDKFKQINTKYHHTGGDEALKAAGEAIRKTFREIDAKARYGGDEFAVLTLDIRKTKELPVQDFSACLNRNLNDLRPSFMQPDELRATVGLIKWDGRETREELFQRVDKMMMSKKENG
jgi:diguanylate cyclase (GGDEF)-like protein